MEVNVGDKYIFKSQPELVLTVIKVTPYNNYINDVLFDNFEWEPDPVILQGDLYTKIC